METSQIIRLVIYAIVVFYLIWKYIIKRKLPSKDPDELVIDQLKKAGSNVLLTHNVDFFLYFPTLKNAESAQVDLTKIGIIANVTKSAQGDEWLCQGKKEMLPIYSQMSSISKQLTEIAQKNNGIYDGWGAGVES